jgi:hypothetical protein
MLVKLQSVYQDQPIWVNPAHVKTLRNEVVSKKAAPQTIVEYALTDGDGDLIAEPVYGTLDEVAAKLNGEGE